MEKGTVYIGFAAAIISLIVAIIDAINRKKNDPKNTINIRGKNGTVNQDNTVNNQHNTNINLVYKPVKNVTNKTSNSGDDNATFVLIIVFLVLMILYQNRDILLKLIYIPITVMMLLSIIICIFKLKNISYTQIHKNNTISFLFHTTPLFVSLLFLTQIYIILPNNELNIDIGSKIQIALAILCNYLGFIVIIIAQVYVLVAKKISSQRIKKIFQALATLWYGGVFFPLIPFIYWFALKV